MFQKPEYLVHILAKYEYVFAEVFSYGQTLSRRPKFLLST